MTIVPSHLVPDATAPCPTWCSKPEGHRFETGDHEGTWYRYHSLEVPDGTAGDDLDVWVSAVEKRLPDGLVTLGPPTADVPEALYLDAAGLRRFAAAILNAADALDKVDPE